MAVSGNAKPISVFLYNRTGSALHFENPESQGGASPRLIGPNPIPSDAEPVVVFTDTVDGAPHTSLFDLRMEDGGEVIPIAQCCFVLSADQQAWAKAGLKDRPLPAGITAKSDTARLESEEFCMLVLGKA